MSLAHHGVLFLDEFPLFRADIIEALRQPLESGEVTIARGEESATFPARAMVVLASNPCPCGDYHPRRPGQPVHLHRGPPPRLPQEAQRPGRRPHRHRPARRAGARRTRLATRWPARSRPPRSGPRVDRGTRAAGRALRRASLAAQRRRARARLLSEHWPLHRGGHAVLEDGVYARPAHPPRRRPGSTGWPGRSPTWAGVDRPGVDELDVALRLRTGDPLLLSHRWRRRA